MNDFLVTSVAVPPITLSNVDVNDFNGSKCAALKEIFEIECLTASFSGKDK